MTIHAKTVAAGSFLFLVSAPSLYGDEGERSLAIFRTANGACASLRELQKAGRCLFFKNRLNNVAFNTELNQFRDYVDKVSD